MAGGTPVAHLLFIAATAVQLAEAQPTSPAVYNGLSGAPAPVNGYAPAVELLGDALRAVLQRALKGLADDEEASVDDSPPHVDAIQGVVRALDTAEEPVSEGSHAGAGDADSAPAAEAFNAYRREVWDALQGFATGPPNTAAAAAARVYILDLLSAIARPAGQASRWGGWRPPAPAPGAGPDAQHSLLLSCTLSVVGPLWSGPAGDVSADDMADVNAARALFQRLLEASDSAGQLMALADLLESTWRDGRELSETPGADGEDAGKGQPGQADAAGGSTAANADSDAITVSWIPAVTEASNHVDVPAECPLHDCWAALLVAMVRHEQVAAAVKLLDAHAGQPPRLTAAEAHSVAAAAHEYAGAFRSLCTHVAFRVAVVLQRKACVSTDLRHVRICL